MYFRNCFGYLHSEKKEYMQAKEYFERLIELTPEDPIAWYNLAGAYEELDNPQISDYNTLDMAVQAYMKVLEFDPAHLESSFKLMDIAFTLKKSDMAVKVMEEAVEHSPDEPLAYYNLINTYEKCILHFPERLRPVDEKTILKWQDEIRKLEMIDKVPFEWIEKIVGWARKDLFWQTNFLSILKLRKKDKQGMKYIRVFYERMKAENEKVAKKTSNEVSHINFESEWPTKNLKQVK